MTDFHNSKIVTAKKDHVCDGCRKHIKSGEKYVYGAGSFEGDFYHVKHHQDCHDIQQKINARIGEPYEYQPVCEILEYFDGFLTEEEENEVRRIMERE